MQSRARQQHSKRGRSDQTTGPAPAATREAGRGWTHAHRTGRLDAHSPRGRSDQTTGPAPAATREAGRRGQMTR
jgi:hypothetical protein